jgi:hypothetical protein
MLKLALPLSILFAASISNAADGNLKSITIYGNSQQIINSPIIYRYDNSQSIPGYAYVTYEKEVNFRKGQSLISINDIPERVDVNSINLNQYGKGKTLLEQYVTAKTATDELVENAGKVVTVEQIAGDKVIERTGTILPYEKFSHSNEIAILQDDGKIALINNPSMISYQKPENFDPKTSFIKNNSPRYELNWLFESNAEGTEKLEYSYKIAGISWATEYRFDIAKANEATAQLEGWVNIINYSGLEFKADNLKLIAGQVNSAPVMAQLAAAPRAMMAKEASFDAAGSAPASFSNESFSDLQSYSIDRQVILPKQTSKKIKLFENKPNVKFEREYIVDSNSGGDSVSVNFKLINKVENGLGNPLPAGKFKVFESDRQGVSQFIGENTINNSTINDEVNVVTGTAFDVKSKRTVTNQVSDNSRRTGSFDVQYEISNQKSTDVKVQLREYVYQENWDIAENTTNFQKTDANRAEFVVPVKANSKEIVKFKVNYKW